MSYARIKLAETLRTGGALRDKSASSVIPAYGQNTRDLEYREAVLRAQIAAIERARGAGRKQPNMLEPDQATTRALLRAAKSGPETPYDAHLRVVGSDPNLGAIARSMTAPAVMFSDAYYGDDKEDQVKRQQILAVLQALNGG